MPMWHWTRPSTDVERRLRSGVILMAVAVEVRDYGWQVLSIGDLKRFGRRLAAQDDFRDRLIREAA
jgi:hypothetical protein